MVTGIIQFAGQSTDVEDDMDGVHKMLSSVIYSMATPDEEPLRFGSIQFAKQDTKVVVVSNAQSGDEDAVSSIGGMPIVVRRIADKWYLVEAPFGTADEETTLFVQGVSLRAQRFSGSWYLSF